MNTINHPDITRPAYMVINDSASCYNESQALTIPIGALRNRRITNAKSWQAGVIQDFESTKKPTGNLAATYEGMDLEVRELARLELGHVARLHSYDFRASTSEDVFAVITSEKKRREEIKASLGPIEIGSSLYTHRLTLCKHLQAWISAQEEQYDAAIVAMKTARSNGEYAAKVCTLYGMQRAFVEETCGLGRGLQVPEAPQAPNLRQLVQTVRNGALGFDEDVVQAADELSALAIESGRQQMLSAHYAQARDLIMGAYQDATSAKFSPSVEELELHHKKIKAALDVAATAVGSASTGAYLELAEAEQKQFAEFIARLVIANFASPCASHNDLDRKVEQCRELLNLKSYKKCDKMSTFAGSLVTGESILLPLIVLREKLELLTDDIEVCPRKRVDRIPQFESEAKNLVEHCSVYSEDYELIPIESKWLRQLAMKLNEEVIEATRNQKKKLDKLRVGNANG